MPRARVGGVHLHYAQTGRGPDVVMVHGLGANLAFWGLRIAPLLAREFRVTTYDLRGHGRSDAPPAGYTCADMAGDLLGLMEQLELGPAHLVGHSFGGGVALLAAVLRPDRVRTLVLADAIVPGLRAGARRGTARRWRAVRRRLEERGMELPPTAGPGSAELLDRVADPGLRAARAGGGAGLFVPFGLWNGAPRAALQWRALLRATTAARDFAVPAGLDRARLAEVRQPALALYGARSRYLPTGRALRRALPACRARLVPGAGHFHPMLQPGVVAREVRRFLRAAERRGTAAPEAPGAGHTPSGAPDGDGA
ncbi:MAG TPA: alpha/beta hydrolase [Longimicrobium sp.]|nr:alpha/beta hydrolase [Longimicrobium sp.]